jgi:hypothetical protein
MRCKICSRPTRNIPDEDYICKICKYIIDMFSWNGNKLQEYWK